MTPEEKLEKVEELIAARDEIIAELLELLGAVDEEEEEVVEEPTPKRGRPKKETTTTKAKSAAGRKPCEECGSIGSRHFKTCSKSGDAKEPEARTILDEPARLNEAEYKEVREQLDDGLTVTEVGFNYPKVELSEIRKARLAESFRDYISGL